MSDWHRLDTTDVIEQLGTDSAAGLTTAEAARRLEEYGPNELQAAHGVSPWEILLDQVKNVLIIILVIAVALSAFLGHGLEALVIGIIVVFAVLLGFVQEYRAERAIQALRQMAAPTATVLRDGREVDVPARDVVPGDVVRLAAGDRIPADARLIEAINLQTDEAALTGESLPVEKQTAPLEGEDLPVGDRRNMVYSGTAATYGRGRAVVVATGMKTQFGEIAQLLQTVESTKTPLQENLDRVGRALAIGALVVVVLIAALGLLRGQTLLDMVIFGIALAVAVVPEALPAVVTISLAIGVQRMVKRNALIRRLTAVEALGSVSVICSDKTGTLTKDEMTARRILVGGETLEVSGAGYEPKGEFLHAGGAVAAVAGPPRPAAGRGARLRRPDRPGGRPLGREGRPDRGCPGRGRRQGRARQAGPRRHAPAPPRDPVHLRDPAHDHPPRDARRDDRVHQGRPGGDPGVLHPPRGRVRHAAARRDGARGRPGRRPVDGERRPARPGRRREARRDRAVGRVRDDLPRPGRHDRPAPAGGRRSGANLPPRRHQAGHDHGRPPAHGPGRRAGARADDRRPGGHRRRAGPDVPEDLKRDLQKIDVFARVSPAHKLQIVSALQESGHLVAMTGDGVNDAPALKKADIGVAMGITGTDVSKEAAAMTLTDDNFASIVAAVEEGRGVYGNIKKYLMYLLSSNVGEMFLMAGRDPRRASRCRSARCRSCTSTSSRTACPRWRWRWTRPNPTS